MGDRARRIAVAAYLLAMLLLGWLALASMGAARQVAGRGFTRVLRGVPLPVEEWHAGVCVGVNPGLKFCLALLAATAPVALADSWLWVRRSPRPVRARRVAWAGFGVAAGGIAAAVGLNTLWGWPAARGIVPDGPRGYAEAVARLHDRCAGPPGTNVVPPDGDWVGYPIATALGMILGLAAGPVAARLTRKEQRWTTHPK